MSASVSGAAIAFRDSLRSGDPEAVRALIQTTDFFRPGEVDIAFEVTGEALAKGQAASGYFHYMADYADAAAGRLAGYACWGPATGSQYGHDLYWIAVDPRRQGRGLGKLLLAEAETRAAAAGGRTMYVETSGMAKYAPTQAFYLACGYREVARLRDFYLPGDDKVIYAKPLPAPRRAS